MYFWSCYNFTYARLYAHGVNYIAFFYSAVIKEEKEERQPGISLKYKIKCKTCANSKEGEKNDSQNENETVVPLKS